MMVAGTWPADASPFQGVADRELRDGTGLKWHHHPAEVLPMWVAEMDARPTPAVVSAVHDAVASGNTGYPHGHDFADALAGFAADRWGWEIDPARTVAVADVMTGIREVIAVLSEPRGPVVVTPPVYGPFMDVVELAGCRRVDAPLGADGRLDMATLADALERAATLAFSGPVLLLCSPHNPTGVVHTRAELEQVAQLAHAHGARVVVDEIHAPLVRPGVAFTPWLTVEGGSDGISVLSASKAWNLAAVKAALVVGGPQAASDVAAIPELVGHGPSHLGMLAQAAALRDGIDWLDATRHAIDANFDLLRDLLAAHAPDVVMAPAQATYLAWLDFRATGLGDDPAAVLLDRANLALSDGLFFGHGGAGHARMNIATAPGRIRDAVDRIAQVVRTMP